MKWTAKPDTKSGAKGREAIQSGEWIITRTRHSGIGAETIEQYTLYRGGEEVGIYRGADEAKRAAKEAA